MIGDTKILKQSQINYEQPWLLDTCAWLIHSFE